MEERNYSILIVGTLGLLLLLFLCLCSAASYVVGTELLGDLNPQATAPVVVITRVITPSGQNPSLPPTFAPLTPRPGGVVSTPVWQPTPLPYDPDADYETRLLVGIYAAVNPSVVYIETEEGSGSGFVWDSDGHIVTNFHVVHGAEQIVVKFWDEREAQATLVGEDADSDLAVIRVPSEGIDLRPVRLGDSTNLHVGERAIAIGNPFGLEGTMTTGIISALGRGISAPSNYIIPEAIQTDAAVNPGNSGGPLLNARGEVIGIVAQIRSPVRANAGIGFAVPIHIAKRVVPALIKEGKYEHPFIGIRGLTLSPQLNKALGLPPDLRGAYVLEVLPGYPAEKAGIRGGRERVDYPLGQDENGATMYLKKGGDVIIAINDQPVHKFIDLLVYLYRYASPGDTVILTVLRDGKELRIPVTLGVRPHQ